MNSESLLYLYANVGRFAIAIDAPERHLEEWECIAQPVNPVSYRRTIAAL
jgi:hypothetical protein